MAKNDEERGYRLLRLMSLCWIAAGALAFVFGGFDGKFIGVGLALYGALNHTIDALALLVNETQADTQTRLDRIENELSDRSSPRLHTDPKPPDQVSSGDESGSASELVEVLTSKAFSNLAMTTAPDTLRLYTEMVAAGGEEPITGEGIRKSAKLSFQLLFKIAELTGTRPPTNISEAIAFARTASVGYDSPEASERAERARLDAIKDILRRSTK